MYLYYDERDKWYADFNMTEGGDMTGGSSCSSLQVDLNIVNLYFRKLLKASVEIIHRQSYENIFHAGIV